MSIINASKYDSVNALSKDLYETTKHHEGAFLVIGDQVLMVTPAEVAREKIAERVARRLAENPSILHDLQDRLESEEPEGWE
ncbi:MAG: hypothetical protein ACQESR_02135 [Planctomycetota bacterium]